VSRETVEDKAKRYLVEARLTVEYVVGDTVRATCRGSGEVYRLGHDLQRGWWCSCASRTDQCSHLTALRAVAVRTAARPGGRARWPIEEGRPA
jgi:hypothetical protein